MRLLPPPFYETSYASTLSLNVEAPLFWVLSIIIILFFLLYALLIIKMMK